MADAMCGPSNALQQFKQQTDVDRSLHQDRFSSRQHPSQSFRSQNSAGPLLDPEFEAFQAGLDAPLLEHAQTFHPPTGFAASSHNPSWASDFQRMNISSPPPTQQQHFQPGPSTADWAHGFRDQFAQAAPKAQASASSPLAFQQRARGIGNFGFQSSFAQSNYAPAVQSKGIQPVVVDQFDEAAFERAFDMAREDMMADVEETTQSETIEELAEKVEAATQQEATQMLNETAQDIPEQTVNDIVHRIHSSDIEYEPHEILKEEEMLDQQPRNDDDALAATAQELLEKIEHNQSDKFKNSQFLGLMRKLRDREVRVEGDQMVETANASSTSSADATLNASSANSQRVYYGKPQPVPLAALVDTRPTEYAIPSHEQDHDPRRIDPSDGQEVIDLLAQPGPITEDIVPPPVHRYKPWPSAHIYRTAAGCFFKGDMEMEPAV